MPYTVNPFTGEPEKTVSAGSIGALTNIGVDAFTAPGTDPVTPDGSDSITLTGAQVASGTVGANVIRSFSQAENTVTMQVQRTGSSSTQNSALNGVAHFNNNHFSVDANGFVSLLNSSVDTTVTSDALGQTRTLTSIPTTADGSYLIEARVTCFEPATNASAGWSLFALINRTGGVCTIETDTDKIAHIMPVLKTPSAASNVDVNITGSGANIILTVIGIAGKTINWGGFTLYVYRGA